MTPEEQAWLKSEFKKIHEGIAANLIMAGKADAGIRALRDMMCKVQEEPDISDKALYKEFWDRFGEYCQTIETDPTRVLQQFQMKSDSGAHTQGGQK
jgi:hypothetical protein